MQYARIAYNKASSEAFGNFTGLDPLALPRSSRSRIVALAVSNSDTDELRRELRRIILEELDAVLAA